jgi:hypothetical protein
MLVELAAFLWASLPMKPIKAILLRSIYVSPVLPVCLGHPRASGRGSADKKLLFWGDRNGGTRTGRVREQSRSFADAGRRKSPEAVPRRTGRTGERDRTDHQFGDRSRRRNAVVRTIVNTRAQFWRSKPEST